MISHRAKRFFSFIKKGFFLAFVFCFLFSTRQAFAAMSSTNYLLQWDSLSVGSSDTQSSSSYRVRSSVDLGLSAEDMTSSSYGLDGGYRGGVYDPVSTFRIFSQDSSSQVAATSFSGSTVVVTSAAGFASGDRVLLVQNEGISQVSAMGSITSIVGSSITVDVFSGGSQVIYGSGGDYVYKLNSDGTTLPLGGPTSSTVVTGVIGWEATADIQTGYSVYIMENTNLQTTSLYEVPDVSDGSVSVGSSEYGAISSDASLASSLFDTQDAPITSVPQLVASRAAVTFEGRDYLTLKLAISSSQQGGAYSHNLTLLFAGNY
ncbi:MAG: hypothetical protein AAB448_02565 [Patescibacteria group bacterium]